MKPSRIFGFFVLVFLILLGLSFIFPAEGIQVGKEISFHFFSPDNLIQNNHKKNEVTDHIVKNATVTDDPEYDTPDTPELVTRKVPEVNYDSIVRVRIDSISHRIQTLEGTKKGREKLFRFFAAAELARDSTEVIRIMHYGDSQIENDRMTALLRYRLQKVFGGSGCGLVPAIPLYSGNPAFREAYEGDWIRYTGFGRKDSALGHNCYGAMMCFTNVPRTEKEELPWLDFRFIRSKRAARFNRIRLFMHSYADSGRIVFQVNDTTSHTITDISGGFHSLEYDVQGIVEELKIGFDLAEGGRIYGIAFDPDHGLQVDNLAMRGSAGLEFSRSDAIVLDTMMSQLHPGLLILQFGGNVVPYIRNIAFYKKAFTRELKYLGSLFPDVPVIVIGPGDMSKKENGALTTWKTLVPVRDALKEAALKSGCMFWDMYASMGGMNSMEYFVDANPPLASSDYIHFTPRGANLMAEMFYKALMLEYNRYKASLKTSSGS